MIRADVFGWFDSVRDEVPAHDPGVDGVCPACGRVLSPPVMVVSLAIEGVTRIYFFRSHSTCWDELPGEDRWRIESALVDAVAAG
jgi:hypothetical protein